MEFHYARSCKMDCSWFSSRRQRVWSVWIILVIVIVSSIAQAQINGPIRLWRNGITLSSYTSGRVQLLINGQFGNICADEQFTVTEANVVCHQLGFTGASSQSRQLSDSFGSDSLPIVLDKVRCYTKDYLVILQCSYSTTISSSCSSNNDLSVTCFTTRIWDNPYNGQIRLTGGTTVNQGLVEVYCSGQWGTVCGVGLNGNATNSICRQLGYSEATHASVTNSNINTTQPIWLDNVACSTAERCVTDCKSCPVSSYNSSCTHSQDIVVNCFTSTSTLRYTGTTELTCQPNYSPDANVPSTSNGPIRLSRNGVSQPSYSSGRVQIYFNNEWGNICDDGPFFTTEANVICHQLGFEMSLRFSNDQSDSFGSDPLHTVLNRVDCSTSSYLVILQCSYSAIISPLCSDSLDVSVTCGTTKIFFSGLVRLTNGAYVNQGAVEVSCGSVWSSICNDSSFGSDEANTVCRQLGYSTAYRYNHLTLNIPTDSSMILEDVSCNSASRSCLSDCLNCVNATTGCPRTHYATVECYSPSRYQGNLLMTCEPPTIPPTIPPVNNGTNGPIRLSRNGVSTPSLSSGRVDVLFGNRWGYICNDDMFGIDEANVICHQLGYTGAMAESRAFEDGFGLSNSTSVLLSSVSCSSQDFLVILQCSYSSTIDSISCGTSSAASVFCFTTRIWDNPYNGQVRLTRGVTVNQGLVEVYCNEQWGTVCDDFFGQNDADTVCTQLGYSTAISYDHLSIRGSSSQPIWFNRVSCTYARSCIGECRNCPSRPISGCSHSEDITILCTTTTQPTTMTTTCANLMVPGNNTGAIVGGTIAGLVVVAIILFIIYHSDRKKKGLPIVPPKVTNCWNQTKQFIKQPRLPRFIRQLNRQSNSQPARTVPESNSQPARPAPQSNSQPNPSTQPSEPTQPLTNSQPSSPQPPAPAMDPVSSNPQTSAPLFSQAPPPSYDKRDNFDTKVEPPKEDELDLPPAYEPPSTSYLAQTGQYEVNVFGLPPAGTSQYPVAYIPNAVPYSPDHIPPTGNS